MTNQPLTADDIAGTVCSAYGICEDSKLLLQTKIETYAAQQNAELVADNARLDKVSVQLKEYTYELQAENERLKQQLAWQPIETKLPDNKCFLLWNKEHEQYAVGRFSHFGGSPYHNKKWANFNTTNGKFTATHYCELQPPKEVT